MFLGITYNAWHGIIAFFGELLIVFLFSGTGLPSATILFYFLGAFLIGLLLQSLYENYQLYFTDVNGIYGNYSNFVKDSKQDFRNFFIGSALAGLVVLVLL